MSSSRFRELKHTSNAQPAYNDFNLVSRTEDKILQESGKIVVNMRRLVLLWNTYDDYRLRTVEEMLPSNSERSISWTDTEEDCEDTNSPPAYEPYSSSGIIVEVMECNSESDDSDDDFGWESDDASSDSTVAIVSYDRTTGYGA
jgi:hypothetical protein